MSPIDFPQANTIFRHPDGLTDAQVAPIAGYSQVLNRGSLDGMPIVVVAWKPNAEELAILNAGGSVFVSSIGGLMPHYLSVSFEQALNVA